MTYYQRQNIVYKQNNKTQTFDSQSAITILKEDYLPVFNLRPHRLILFRYYANFE